jgi:signal transduction histidine kinase
MTIRRALLLGFGAVLSLWIVSAYVFVRQLHELEAQAAVIARRFARAEELLAGMRGQLLRGSVHLRGLALNLDADLARLESDQLRETRRALDEALQQYLPEVDSDVEREQWVYLREGFDAYWAEMLPLFADGGDTASDRARVLLRAQALSKEQGIVAILEAVRRLNGEAYGERQRDLQLLYDHLRTSVWWTSGLMVALGLLIAAGSTRYAGLLESEIRRQHLQDVHHKLELRDLSNRLVGAQEQERQRIARDLHDEVGQALTAVKVELAAIERDLGPTGHRFERRLREARTITDRTLNTVRDLSQLLHPGMLDDFGLLETVRWYVRGFSKRTGLIARVAADEPFERLPQELEVSAYRIVQEALTNVAKHAEATRCLVRLQRQPASLVVIVEDDGRGMDLRDRRSEHGFGLVSMRERVTGLGGRFVTEPAGTSGTRLVAEFPLPAPARPAVEATAGHRTTVTQPAVEEAVGGSAPHPAG